MASHRALLRRFHRRRTIPHRSGATRTRLANGLAAAALFAAASAALVDAREQPWDQPGWPCEGKVDPSYVRGAEATGGKVMLVHPTEIAATAAEMSASRRHGETVFRAGGHVAGGTYEFDIPIDSTIDGAHFFVSLQCLQSATVIEPSGDELRADEADVEVHEFRAIRMFTVGRPAPGPWRVRATGRGLMTVLVRARTPLSLTRVQLIENGTPVKGEPAPGARLRLVAGLTGAAGRIEGRLIAWGGETLQRVDLAIQKASDLERIYAGEVIVPGAAFRIAVTGVDAGGFPFQRVYEQMFNYSSLPIAR